MHQAEGRHQRWVDLFQDAGESRRCLVWIQEIPPRQARYGRLPEPLPEPLKRGLEFIGIRELFLHQAEAVCAAREGKNVVVVTGTASGKSLCYNLPVLERLLEERGKSSALYLFPTKALCQDQHANLLDLVRSVPPLDACVRSGIYDGDTPVSERRRLRSEGNLILSNPDMLHRAILPHHSRWARFFETLRFVVLDELHTYRGVFGANVACVLRRLKRICAHYGSSPQFLATSATIGNPAELAQQLTGEEFTVIDNDGSPRGRKWFCFWNPPEIPTDRGGRRSPRRDATVIVARLVAHGAQVIAFALSRTGVELLYREIRDLLARKVPELAKAVKAYRGGYLPHERRRIERDLFNGRLRAVVSTNALELGIDVGSMDVAVLVGYPGTIASTWQQAGRAGRSMRDSLAILIARDDPIDQFLVRHPDYFFGRSPEHAVADPSNPHVLARHMLCAAYELPLSPAEDEALFGERFAPLAQAMVQERLLFSDGKRYWATGGTSPAARINLRNMSDNTVTIALRYDDGTTETIATVDELSADQLVYPQAVYLHDGDTYVVREYDLEQRIAYVERCETGYYTQAIVETRVKITREERQREIQLEDALEQGDAQPAARLDPFRAIVREAFDLPRVETTTCAKQVVRVGFGDLDVTWRTVAFKKLRFKTHENLGLGPVSLPERRLSTTGFWLTPSPELLCRACRPDHHPSEALAGMLNLFLQVMPLLAMTDPHDIGGTLDSSNLGSPTIFLYDRYPGGLGYCEKAYTRLPELFRLARDLVKDCPCEDGCPSCVGVGRRIGMHVDPDLPTPIAIPDKQAAWLILEALCNAL